MIPEFKVGYCANCGAQTMVRNLQGAPVMGKLGVRLCWLTLSNEDGPVQTRVGTITICPDCDIAKLNLEEIRDSLINSPLSGIGNEREFSAHPKLGIEVVKTYGD